VIPNKAAKAMPAPIRPGTLLIHAVTIPKLPLITTIGIPTNAAVTVPQAPIDAAATTAPPLSNAAMTNPVATGSLVQLEGVTSSLAAEGIGVVVGVCAGDILGVFMVVDGVVEELVAFATPPAHLVTNGITNTIVTINITKNCFTIC
jgi:hypothetical protein